MARSIATNREANPMSNALLDYSSWSFQLIAVLAILYLVVGLIRPAWVLARKRSTIIAVSVMVLLLASTAFYVAVRPLDSMPDGGGVSTVEKSPPAPQP
jgi:hypothetical protein